MPSRELCWCPREQQRKTRFVQSAFALTWLRNPVRMCELSQYGFLRRDATTAESYFAVLSELATFGILKIEVPNDLQRVVVPDVDARRLGHLSMPCKSR